MSLRKWRIFHFRGPRMKFYDRDLSLKVGFARHAISIDETRKSFDRVPWEEPGVWKQASPQWFEQTWFAGNHSDIGGGYPENESRLSDIALDWMLNGARAVGLQYNPSVLRLYPDPAGMQHDEMKSSTISHYSGAKIRDLKLDAPLHESVIRRFEN